jgi:branched-chain amino acid aminotransferase
VTFSAIPKKKRRKRMAVIYIDGGWYGQNDGKISVYDHGLLYGDGLFEGIRIYSGKIFKLEAHLNRLFQGAGVLLINLPITRDDLQAMLEEGTRRFCEETRISDGYIRLIITRGVGDLGLDPRKCPTASVIAIFDTIELYPKKLYERGIPIITAATRRLESPVFDPRIKTLNYLNNIFAKQEAIQAGCMEAVLLNAGGYVTECTADNIFIVAKGVLKTPAPHVGILEGITRATVMELAAAAGSAVEEAVLTRFDLYTAEECFITGSGAELMPVTSVDGRTIGTGKPGPVTGRLTSAFRKLTA